MAKAKWTSPVIPLVVKVVTYSCRDCGEVFVPPAAADGVNCPVCGTNDCRPVESRLEE